MRGPVRAGLASLLLLAACASTSKDEKDTVEWLVIHGRYEEAVARAAADAQAHPNDEHAKLVHRDATVALLLERGRKLSFDDRDTEALAKFEEANRLAPERPEPLTWIQKTRNKLADHYLEQGLELHASDRLEAAVDSYEKALEYDPGNRSALVGQAEATFAINYRAGLGKGYYESGLHSLSAAWIEQARGEFKKADKYMDGPQIDLRNKQVAVDLAAQRTTVAQGLEQDGKYEAARYEYRFATALDPDNAAAKEGKMRAEVEAHVAQLLRDADMEVKRGREESALAKVEEASRLTVAQKERCEGMKNRVQEARYERIYREALAFERDGKYSDAVASYDELLKIAAYYKDALTRKETLEDFIVRADRLYLAAAAETDAQKKLDVLRQIQQFWPDYKDVGDQVRELVKQTHPQ